MSGETTKKIVALRDSMRAPEPEHDEACREHAKSTERLKASADRAARAVRGRSLSPHRMEKPT
jgi:hypothetical protein